MRMADGRNDPARCADQRAKRRSTAYALSSIGVYTRPDENKNDMLIGVEPEDVREGEGRRTGKVKVVAQGNIDSVSKCRELLTRARIISARNLGGICRAVGNKREETMYDRRFCKTGDHFAVRFIPIGRYPWAAVSWWTAG